MVISKLFRIISFTLLIFPALAVPSSNDGKNTTHYNAWTRPFLYGVTGSLAGALTGWCYLQQKQSSRGLSDSAFSVYLTTTIAGFSVALTIERGTAKHLRPVVAREDEAPRKIAREHKELSHKIPPEPRKLSEILEPNKFYSKKMHKWVVFK